MDKFIKKNEDLLLLTLAFIIVVAIGIAAIWSVVIISSNLSRAIGAPVISKQNVNFNLDGAKKLDLRGFVQ